MLRTNFGPIQIGNVENILTQEIVRQALGFFLYPIKYNF